MLEQPHVTEKQRTTMSIQEARATLSSLGMDISERDYVNFLLDQGQIRPASVIGNSGNKMRDLINRHLRVMPFTEHLRFLGKKYENDLTDEAKMYLSVFILMCGQSESDMQPRCSAFAISDRLVLTASSMINATDEAFSLTTKVYHNKYCRGMKLKRTGLCGGALDWAILELMPTEPSFPYALTLATLEQLPPLYGPGAEVRAINTPMGKYLCGEVNFIDIEVECFQRISSYAWPPTPKPSLTEPVAFTPALGPFVDPRSDPGAHLLFVSGSLCRGSSGAPILDKAGRVVGMHIKSIGDTVLTRGILTNIVEKRKMEVMHPTKNKKVTHGYADDRVHHESDQRQGSVMTAYAIAKEEIGWDHTKKQFYPQKMVLVLSKVPAIAAALLSQQDKTD